MKEGREPSSLQLLYWLELCSLEQGKFGISDSSGAPPSSSPASILRASWMPRALGTELAVAWPVRGEAPRPIQCPFLILTLGCCSLACLGTQTFALCSSKDTPGGFVYVWPDLATVPSLCLPSLDCVPPASLGTEALSEHPSQGPSLPLNLPLETSSRCWRTGCSSGSLSAPGGRMEEEDLGGVKSRP